MYGSWGSQAYLSSFPQLLGHLLMSPRWSHRPLTLPPSVCSYLSFAEQRLGMSWHLTSGNHVGAAQGGSFLLPNLCPQQNLLPAPPLPVLRLPISPRFSPSFYRGPPVGLWEQKPPPSPYPSWHLAPWPGPPQVKTTSVPLITYTHIQSESEAVDSKRPPAEALGNRSEEVEDLTEAYGDKPWVHMALLGPRLVILIPCMFTKYPVCARRCAGCWGVHSGQGEASALELTLWSRRWSHKQVSNKDSLIPECDTNPRDHEIGGRSGGCGRGQHWIRGVGKASSRWHLN